MKHFYTLAALLLALLAAMPMNAAQRGDLTENGKVDVGDVTELVNQLLSGTARTDANDINADGKLDVGDVTSLVTLVLNPVALPTETATYLTALSSGTDYENTKETYIRYEVAAGNDSCDVHIYNVKFAPKAPTLAHISFKCCIAKSSTGYALSGEGIIPIFYMASTSIPFPSAKITGLSGTLNTQAMTSSLTFSAMGSSWSNEGAIIKK